MAHTPLLVAMCLLLPSVIALQTSNSNPEHVFVSSDKMFCAMAPESTASGALDLFKSMPRGKLYEGMELMKGLACCKRLGYNYEAGDDPCYPGLRTFYRSQQEAEQFYNKLQGTLKEFAESKDLTLDDANLVDSCSCKDESYAKKYYGKSCDKALGLSARNPPRTFVSLGKQFCAQAPLNIAKDALNLYKSMPRGKLYDGTVLTNHKSCEDLGYKHSAGEDPCYPGLQTFYRTEQEGEQFYNEMQSTLKEFGETKDLTLDDANLVDSCKCKDKSYAKKYYGKSCDKEFELSARNPPRTFVSVDKLFCAQAPRNLANDALNLYKSMPRGKLYDGIKLSNHKSCEELGYKSSAGEDPCYPGLETFYRNKEEGEQFYEKLQSTLKKFGAKKNMTLHDVNWMEACKCEDKSFAKSNVGKWFSKSCDMAF